MGTRRLTDLIEAGRLITDVQANAHSPAVLFNRLVHLRAQKAELAVAQRLIERDSDLENAIRAVDNQIERVQGDLSRLANATSGRNAQ